MSEASPKGETVQSLIHISPGSVPSQYAHTVQIMKMAEALSDKVRNFELLTSGDLWSILTGKKLDISDLYGLHKKFRITRIPTNWNRKYSLTEHYCGGSLYYRLSALYCMIKSPTLIYTRTLAGIETILKTNIPVLWEHHTTLTDAYFRGLTKYPNLIGIVVTTANLGEIAIAGGVPPERILVEQSAVDLNNFLPYQTKSQARSKIHLDGNRPVVTYVGHLYERKGTPTILDVAAQMPLCEFVLVGGWEKDVVALKETCRTRNLQNVRLIGHVNQSRLPDYFYAADILILPTSDHPDHTLMGSQLKLFEYMASRRPFVASALPTVKTIVMDGYNALLAEPDNPSSFRNAIEKLSSDPKLSEKISEQAYEDVQYYTWDKRAERILKFAGERLLHARKKS